MPESLHETIMKAPHLSILRVPRLFSLACLYALSSFNHPLLLAFFFKMSSSTCYNPDWTPFTSPAFQPCDQFNNVYSMCCGTNHTDDGVARDICEPSGLCLGQFFNSNGSYLGPADWREGCTDQTWQSPNCLRNVCTDPSVRA
jgi:hypothetical protein